MARLKLAPMGLDPRVHLRGLDHASRVYSTCELEVPELGYTRVRVVHLLRDKFFLRSGWIASDLGLARGPHINKVPQVGYARLAVSSPAMTEVSAYDRKMLSSTTLADLLTPPLGAHPFSTMRASLRRQSSEEFDDCVAHGGQSWLRRRAVDSFFSASLLRDGGAGGRRKRSLS